MDYKKTGRDVFEAVGGNDNVTQMTHCATRLRFVVRDSAKVDAKKIQNTPGVLGYVEKGGQIQIVIGQDVPTAYHAAEELYAGSRASHKGADDEKSTLFNKIMAIITGIFTPMLPAITGAGMIKAVLALLKAFQLIDVQGQTFATLSFISDAAFYFMPMILAYSSAKTFKCSPALAITLAGVLLHPSFASMRAAGDPVFFAGFSVALTSYASTVIPIILIVYVMSHVERFANRILPVYIKYIGKPLIVLLVTAPLALIVLGPLGYYLGSLLANGVAFVDAHASWLVPTLIGTLTPIMVMFGLHTGLFPIATTQLSVLKHESIMGPGMLPSNIAQGSACLAVALKTKNPEMRQMATSAGITALLGITEPAMYGVTFRLKTPLIAVMIGGGLGGLYAGLMGVVRFSFGSPGFATLPVFIGDDPANFKHALIAAFIGLTVPFFLTLLFRFDLNLGSSDTGASGKDGTNGNTNGSANASPSPAEDDCQNAPAPATSVINSPLAGEAVSLEEVGDEVFSKGLLGKGVAVRPSTPEIRAPFAGTVSVFPTKHAIGFMGDNGVELLVHIGLDTVKLDGKHFTGHVENASRVEAGDLIVSFNPALIQEEGYDLITPVIVANHDSFADVDILRTGPVEAGAPLLKARAKTDGSSA